jgi:hypothetical protein
LTSKSIASGVIGIPPARAYFLLVRPCKISLIPPLGRIAYIALEHILDTIPAAVQPGSVEENVQSSHPYIDITIGSG